MTDTATSAAMEAELISRITRLVDEIDAKTTQLHASLNRKLPLLPAGLGDKVADGWNQFCDAISGWWTFWREVVTNMGSPTKLFQTADAWSDQVGGPVSAQVQLVDAGRLTVDTNWDGDAAEAYRQLLPAQKAALEKIKSVLTDGIVTSLSDVAKGIYVLWGALAAALAALVGGLVSAIFSSSSIVGIPAAPFIALGAALAAVVALNVGLMNLKSTCLGATTTLRQKLNDDSSFGGGHWPPTTTG